MATEDATLNAAEQAVESARQSAALHRRETAANLREQVPSWLMDFGRRLVEAQADHSNSIGRDGVQAFKTDLVQLGDEMQNALSRIDPVIALDPEPIYSSSSGHAVTWGGLKHVGCQVVLGVPEAAVKLARSRGFNASVEHSTIRVGTDYMTLEPTNDINAWVEAENHYRQAVKTYRTLQRNRATEDAADLWG